MDNRIADSINILSRFCGKRDIQDLSAAALQRTYGITQADVMVLFGGSIICGGDILAYAIKNNIAKHYVIAGGIGHTTETLRQTVHTAYPSIDTSDLSEAEIFNTYLKTVYNLHADYLETQSTNCGNNITYVLDLLKKHSISFTSIILCQDATMQRRMEAGLRKYISDNILVINYATYAAEVSMCNNKLNYVTPISGMWDINRYITLLMGEIPRLTDNSRGYGPLGKNFIAHVDIPADVQNAFEYLKTIYGTNIREANPRYASRE